MDLRPITETYTVAPQLAPADMAKLAEMGVHTVICNRPDGEVPGHLQASLMQEAAEAAGLAFVFNPITHGGLSMQQVEEQADAIEAAEGAPVVAYCASGNRCTIMWGLVNAGLIDTDTIIEKARNAGYSLEGLRGQIDALASRAG